MLKSKPFVMSEPRELLPGHWGVYINIDKSYWDFIKAMPCVQATEAWIGHEIKIYIDPRYDYEEAWLWIYEQLEAETNEVKLDDVWESD